MCNQLNRPNMVTERANPDEREIRSWKIGGKNHSRVMTFLNTLKAQVGVHLVKAFGSLFPLPSTPLTYVGDRLIPSRNPYRIQFLDFIVLNRGLWGSCYGDMLLGVGQLLLVSVYISQTFRFGVNVDWQSDNVKLLLSAYMSIKSVRMAMVGLVLGEYQELATEMNKVGNFLDIFSVLCISKKQFLLSRDELELKYPGITKLYSKVGKGADKVFSRFVQNATSKERTVTPNSIGLSLGEVVDRFPPKLLQAFSSEFNLPLPGMKAPIVKALWNPFVAELFKEIRPLKTLVGFLTPLTIFTSIKVELDRNFFPYFFDLSGSRSLGDYHLPIEKELVYILGSYKPGYYLHRPAPLDYELVPSNKEVIQATRGYMLGKAGKVLYPSDIDFWNEENLTDQFLYGQPNGFLVPFKLKEDWGNMVTPLEAKKPEKESPSAKEASTPPEVKDKDVTPAKEASSPEQKDNPSNLEGSPS